MYKYLFFIICGIILYILWNKYDGFSIGIPNYALLIDSNNSYSIEEAGGGSDGTQTLLWTGELDTKQYGEVNEYTQYNDEDPRNTFDFLGDEIGVPPEPCPVEEGEPPPIDCYRAKLISLNIDEDSIDYILDQYKIQLMNLQKKLKFSCAVHSRLGAGSPFFSLAPDLLQEVLDPSDTAIFDPGTETFTGGVFDMDDFITIIRTYPLFMDMDMYIISLILLRLGLTTKQIIDGIEPLINIGISDSTSNVDIIINVYLFIKSDDDDVSPDDDDVSPDDDDVSPDDDDVSPDRDFVTAQMKAEFTRMVNGDPG